MAMQTMRVLAFFIFLLMISTLALMEAAIIPMLDFKAELSLRENRNCFCTW
jgi:hypothetical protein